MGICCQGQWTCSSQATPNTCPFCSAWDEKETVELVGGGGLECGPGEQCFGIRVGLRGRVSCPGPVAFAQSWSLQVWPGLKGLHRCGRGGLGGTAAAGQGQAGASCPLSLMLCRAHPPPIKPAWEAPALLPIRRPTRLIY